MIPAGRESQIQPEAAGAFRYLSLLGLNETFQAQAYARGEQGLEFSRLEGLRDRTGLSLERLAEAARIPLATVHRRRREGHIPPLEADRLLRLSRVIGKAVDLFEGDMAGAIRWLSSPQSGLDGGTPLDLAGSDAGAGMVVSLIERLEDGVFT